MQGLGWLGALGLLSSSMIWTPNQVSAYEQDPTIDSVAHDSTAQPEWTPEPTADKPEWTPEPTAYEPEWTPEPTTYQSEVIDDAAVPVVIEAAPLSYSAQDLMPASESGGDSYIDASTDFEMAAPEAIAAESPAVIVSERSTGCEAVIENGAVIDAVCGSAAAAAPVATEPEPVDMTAPTASQPIPAWSVENYQPVAGSQSADAGDRAVESAPPGVGGTTASGRSYFNARKPLGLPGNGNVSLLYPLAIPAQITSHFGWRLHPIYGEWRLHSGTDIAAATGTHVLAALGGRVAIANFLGGYGLTVVIEHNNGTQETLYAHLSQIFVQPGDEVAQGTVIGNVGSTGNSTGPHLHFELRQQTEEGWVAVDAGAQLEYALARLIQSWETASATPYTGGGFPLAEKLPAPELSAEELPYVNIRS